MRLFIAAKIPDEIRAELSDFIDQFLQFPGKVKWVEPENIHITLKFLGETEPRLFAPVKEAAAKAAETFGAIDLVLQECGAFPNLKAPRVFWIGIVDEEKRLRSLAEKIDSNLADIGFEREKRPFSPHLTLGRVKEPSRLELLTGAFRRARFAPHPFSVNAIHLIESHLRPAGPIYVDLAEFAL